VEHAREKHELSERHACRLANQWRGTQRYLPIQRVDEAKWSPGMGGYPAGHALQYSDPDDVLMDAVNSTSYNSGNFSELVEMARAVETPVHHLAAAHSWSGGSDSFGTKVFRVFRISDHDFICHDHTSFG
jgi:hypothetical protein